MAEREPEFPQHEPDETTESYMRRIAAYLEDEHVPIEHRAALMAGHITRPVFEALVTNSPLKG